MFHRLFALVVLVVCLAAPTVAEAKKVPLPCSGDRFVVVEVPSFKEVAKAKGLDLAYRFSGCSGAGFVVYDGSHRYMPLPDSVLAAVAEQHGRPLEAPGLLKAIVTAPTHFWVEWLYGLLVLGGVVAVVLNRRAGATQQPAAVATGMASAKTIPPQAEPQQPLRATPRRDAKAPLPVARPPASRDEPAAPAPTRAVRPARALTPARMQLATRKATAQQQG